MGQLPLRFLHPACWTTTWFGAGLLPKAPGTWGSLAALPIAWLMTRYAPPYGLLVLAIGTFAVGWWGSARLVRVARLDDPSFIVIDEVVGQWLTLLWLPNDPTVFAAGFFLFRLFDIAKPGPIGWCDRHIKGGLGVMLDDVAAAAFAWPCLASMTYLFLT